MNHISTSKARAELPKMIDVLKERDGAFVIGRRNQPEAVLIKFPLTYRNDASDITNVNAYSRSFDFLDNEPELYTLEDGVKIA